MTPPLADGLIGNFNLTVKTVQKQCRNQAENQTQSIGNAALYAAHETGIRDNRQRCRDNDADDKMGHRGMMLLKQIIHPFCKNDDRQQSADTAGNQNTEINVAYSFHERRIQAERH